MAHDRTRTSVSARNAKATSFSHKLSTPDQSPPTSTNDALIERWDDPQVISQHLSSMPEPTPNNLRSIAALRGRAAIAKNLLRKAEEMKEALAPRTSLTIETLIAEKAYKRKFSVWSSFPINALPTEILQEIFRFFTLCVDTNQLLRHRLILPAVCRYWRNVALSDPKLWNTIYISESPPWTRSLTFMERAAAAKLEIRIDEPRTRQRHQRATNATPVPSITPEQIDVLLDVILQKIAHLRIFVIAVDRWDTARTVMRRFASAGEAKSLERFELHRGLLADIDIMGDWVHRPHDPNEANTPYTLFNGTTPKLSWLCLNGVNINWQHLNPATLTTFDIRRMPQSVLPDGPTFRRIISSCSNLIRLFLTNAGPQLSSLERGLKPIPLLSLRELLVGDCSVEYAIRCIEQLHTPNVVGLTLLNVLNVNTSELFVSLTGRYPKLKVLSTYTIQISATTENKAAIVRWLDSVPQLLLIKVAEVPSFYLDCFLEDPRQFDEGSAMPETDDSPRRIIAPKLTGIQCSHLSLEYLQQFLTRRRKMGVPLKNFYIPPMFAQLGMSREKLGLVRSAGVRVKVMYVNMATEEEIEVQQSLL